MNIKLIVTSLLLAATAAAQPQHREYTPSPVAGTAWNAPGNANPFIPGYFADPTIRKFGDTYYLYATTDGTGNGYGPAQVWVSKDFCNWQNIVMNWPVTEVVWAPDVVQQPDGRFRYYYCEPCVVSIGESDSPIGPWKNILGKEDAVMVPDRYVHNAITLDPQLFRDDDGSEYLYFTTWGIYKGFGCGVAKLGTYPQPVKKEGGNARFWNENSPFPIAADTFFTEKRLIPNTELKDIFEAPFVFKRNGIYYFTYSSGSCHTDTYRVQYAVSKTGPMGPFEYKGELLTTNEDQTVHGPGHHSVIEADGRYYIVYHRHNIAKSVHGFNRQVCIDEMKFDEQGNILPIVPTHNAQNVDLIAPRHSSSNAKACKNIALGAKVTASSYYDDEFRPEYAVDDNNATLWKARHGNWDFSEAAIGSRRIDPGRTSAEWLQLDLGTMQTFSEVWTQFEYATFFYQYKIETSEDGHLWTLFADRQDNVVPGSPMVDRASAIGSKSVTARYLRLTITDTQKNGHLPAVWNVKVWKEAPALPYPDATEPSANASRYSGTQSKDVEPKDRKRLTWGFGGEHMSLIAKATAPYDVEEVDAAPLTFKANKPLRMRVKDGRWALFFNGTQHLVSESPLFADYSYNAPFTIVAEVLSTKVGPVSTVLSLGTSRADLANTELRMGTDPQAGLMNHNGSFESYGAPKEVKDGEGHWQIWIITYDGWKERAYLDGQLVHEQNNFIMFRPEGHVTIGADATGANHFMGYISTLEVHPYSMDEHKLKSYFATLKEHGTKQSLGDDDFEETDPDSKFTLAPEAKAVYRQKSAFTLSTQSSAFNDDPLQNGGKIYKKDVKGDFVVMCRLADMEGLDSHGVTAYNEGGLLIADSQGTFYQLGVFPLYNCGNMFTVLSRRGRPQFPNYKGYAPNRYMQFERRGDQLFARTSADGQTWENMPGSPVSISVPTLSVGAYQTTYTDHVSWVKLCDYVIYQAK